MIVTIKFNSFHNINKSDKFIERFKKLANMPINKSKLVKNANEIDKYIRNNNYKLKICINNKQEFYILLLILDILDEYSMHGIKKNLLLRSNNLILLLNKYNKNNIELFYKFRWFQSEHKLCKPPMQKIYDYLINKKLWAHIGKLFCYKKSCNDKTCLNNNKHMFDKNDLYCHCFKQYSALDESRLKYNHCKYFIKYIILLNYLFDSNKIFLAKGNINVDFSRWLANQITINDLLYKHIYNKKLFTFKLLYPISNQFIRCINDKILYINNSSKLKLMKIIYILNYNFNNILSSSKYPYKINLINKLINKIIIN